MQWRKVSITSQGGHISNNILNKDTTWSKHCCLCFEMFFLGFWVRPWVCNLTLSRQKHFKSVSESNFSLFSHICQIANPSLRCVYLISFWAVYGKLQYYTNAANTMLHLNKRATIHWKRYTYRILGTQLHRRLLFRLKTAPFLYHLSFFKSIKERLFYSLLPNFCCSFGAKGLKFWPRLHAMIYWDWPMGLGSRAKFQMELLYFCTCLFDLAEIWTVRIFLIYTTTSRVSSKVLSH